MTVYRLGDGRYIQGRYVQEIVEFLGVPEEEVLHRLNNPGVMEEWNAWVTDDEDREQITRFYRENTAYIYDLMKWHYSSADPSGVPDNSLNLRETKDTLLGHCYLRREQIQTAIDYGCGVAAYALDIAPLGFELTLAEVPGKVFDFARWRTRCHGYQFKEVEILDDAPLKESYDLIICHDVFEHLPDPVKVARHLFQHLNPGGQLHGRPIWGGPSEAVSCPHLRHNQVLDGGRWEQVMAEIGFRLVPEYGRSFVWQKTP